MLKVRTRYGAFTSYPYRFDVCSSRLPYLQEVGELTALAPHTSSRSNLPSYLFFIVTDGAGSFKYLGKEYELSVGDAVFIDCSDKLIRDTLGVRHQCDHAKRGKNLLSGNLYHCQRK